MLSIIKNMVKHKYVVRNFVLRDIKIKYRDTFLGYLWSLLEPMSMVAIYDFVFRGIMHRGAPNYPLLLVLGILPYNYVAAVVQGGAGALVTNAALIRRVPLPREIFVLSSVGSNLVIFLLSMLSAIPFMIAFHMPFGWRILLFPIPVILLTILGAGFAFLAACANVYYRDVTYVIRVLTRLLLYLSPVVYELDKVPDTLKVYYLANPLSVFLTMARNWMLDRPLHLPTTFTVLSILFAFGSLVVGAYVFRRLENHVVKHL